MFSKAVVDTLSEGINVHQKVLDGHKLQRNITVEEMNQEISANQKNAFEAILFWSVRFENEYTECIYALNLIH